MHLKLNFKSVSPLQAKALAAYFGTIAAGSEVDVAKTSAETPINIKKLSAELKTEEKAPEDVAKPSVALKTEEKAPQGSKTTIEEPEEEPEENAAGEKEELSAAEIKRERKRQTDRNGRRRKKLSALGLKWDPEAKSFDYEDINFHWTDVVCMTDEEFKKAVAGAKLRKEAIDDENVEDDFDDENGDDKDDEDKDDEVLDPEELKRAIKEQIAAKSKDRAIKKQMKFKITELGADTWKALPDEKLPELLAHFKSL